MAGSDEKPDDNSSEADDNMAASTAEDTAGEEAPAGKVASKDTESDPSEEGAADTGDAADTDDKEADAPEDGEADGTDGDRPELEELAAEDSPSGEVADPEAGLKPSEPMKLGPLERGADTLEADQAPGDETEPETEEIPDLSAQPELEAESPQPLAPAHAAQKASAMPMIFGGIIAGLIGFAAAWAIWGRDGSAAELGARLTQQEDAAAGTSAALEGKASAEDLAALDTRVAALESAPAATVDTSALEASVAAQEETVAALAARIDTLEKAPVEGSTDEASQAALAAYGREVEALRAEVAEQMSQMNAALDAAKETEAQAAARQEEAAAAAARAAEQSALLDVQQALDAGTPYSEALGRISSAEIPEGLAAHAEEGVMTLDALKESFPAAARNALKVSREETAGEEGGGFGSWITRQVGARSLEPKEGDDPDAVLSRAEAALNAGDLATTLDELSALPPGGQAAMDQWIAQASRRNDAVTGADALAATLTSN